MNKKTSKRRLRRERIKRHVRKRVQGTPECPRLCVYRSLKAIYAQVIDDKSNQTLYSVSSLSKSLSGEIAKTKSKVEAAKIVGQAAGEEAKKRKIEKVVFDRNGYLFHGRVKAVAEGAREAGLIF
jgi:large subunit ribosomal protein L18